VRVLGAVLAGLAIWRWHRWRLARIAAQNRALEAEIDERKRAQSEASRAASELAHVSRLATAGELATSLAHELNQPLTAVMSNAQAARQMHRLGIDDELEPVLDDVVAQAERAAGVVRAMRAFVRKQEPTSAPVDPAQLVDETLRLLHSELMARGVTARTEQAGEPASMRGDRVQLQQVLVNLVLNAADAVRELPPERRSLLVHWGKDGDGNVDLAVRDRGPGLTPAQVQRSLEPFYTTKASGLGMGLPLSRSIVEAHGGSLVLDSVPGVGTAARIRVPIWREA
jgi:C4-dicarboxylate-specific signal transduction histidine kinase